VGQYSWALYRIELSQTDCLPVSHIGQYSWALYRIGLSQTCYRKTSNCWVNWRKQLEKSLRTLVSFCRPK
jgi:hypothetical protein